MEILQEAFENLVLYVLGQLPTTNFTPEQYAQYWSSYLSYLNYFVPFYAFANIMSVWIGTITVSVGVIALFKFLRR